MPGFEEQWSQHRRRRNAAWLLFLAYLPAVAVLAWFSLLLLHSIRPVYAGAALWMGALAVAWTRFVNWRCPRCGKAFQSAGWSQRAFTSNCVHCGLRKFGAESDSAWTPGEAV